MIRRRRFLGMNRKILTYASLGVIGFLTIAVIVLSALLGVFVTKYNNARSSPPSQAPTLTGLDFVINTTWDSQPITHPPIEISLRWNEYNRAINLMFKAPLYRNPPAPNHTAGAVPQLYNYEVFEMFFLNSENHYLELELGPYNQWLVLLLNGTRKYINYGDQIQLSVWNQLGNNTWEGQAEIPLAYLPSNFTLLNAYNIHNEGNTTVYEAMYPAPQGTYQGPDFHRLNLFKPVDHTKLIPAEYYSETKPYRDYRYEDLWAGFY